MNENDTIAEFNNPICAVDTIIFTVKDHYLQVLTLKRQQEPFKDCWSLTGGIINSDSDTDLEATARRKLLEKTGVETPYLEQFITVGNAKRDPRGWSVSTVYFALIPSEKVVLKSATDNSAIQWTKITKNDINLKLAFDHNQLLKDCLERLRQKVLYSTIPIFLLPEEFTLSELKKVYEIIMDKTIDLKTFHRRLLRNNILEDTGKQKKSGHRPAKVYRLANPRSTYYFSRNMGEG